MLYSTSGGRVLLLPKYGLPENPIARCRRWPIASPPPRAGTSTRTPKGTARARRRYPPGWMDNKWFTTSVTTDSTNGGQLPGASVCKLRACYQRALASSETAPSGGERCCTNNIVDCRWGTAVPHTTSWVLRRHSGGKRARAGNSGLRQCWRQPQQTRRRAWGSGCAQLLILPASAPSVVRDSDRPERRIYKKHMNRSRACNNLTPI